jgi:hypothetical protein
MWMKEPHHTINRSGGSACDSNEGNNVAKAHKKRIGKLHQLGLVTLLIAVNLPKMMKPAILVEETEKSTLRAIRGKMVLRVSRRLRMNVGGPNSMAKPP